jgi:hypothetical protein
LSVAAPSSFASIWFTTPRMADPPPRRCDRFWPSASISSKNSRHGRLRRAVSKIDRRLRSLLPIHMSSTSLRPIS